MYRRWLPYLVALLAAAAALGLRAALDPWLSPRVPYITLFGAIIVAAWFGGAGPALVAAVAAWAGALVLFVQRVPPIEAAAYALSSLLIAGLGGAMQRAWRRANESEERFRIFMQNSPNGAFLKDEDGRYVFMNRSITRRRRGCYTNRKNARAVLSGIPFRKPGPRASRTRSGWMRARGKRGSSCGRTSLRRPFSGRRHHPCVALAAG